MFKVMHLIFLLLLFLFLLLVGVEVLCERVGVEVVLDGEYHSVFHFGQTEDPHAVHPYFA